MLAAIKAFVVNRVGDFGFLLGIMALFYLNGLNQVRDVFAATPDLAAKTTLGFLWSEWNAANSDCDRLLFLTRAMVNSAQLFCTTWLPADGRPDTRVGAIHAATMVTAGSFLICRMSH